MKNTLVAAALMLATLGCGQLATAQNSTATHATIAAAPSAHLTTVSPADLGWGGAPAPTAG
jgi:hypothetical protein